MSHLEEVIRVLGDINQKEIEKATDEILKSKHINIIGNGGSAATAMHFANDLFSRGLKAHVLSNVSLITKIGNDEGYLNLFMNWMKDTEEDSLLVAITVSGNSPNIMRAVRSYKGPKLLFIGNFGLGGAVDYCKNIIIVNHSNFEVCEDVHLAICHAIVRCIDGRRETSK